MIPQIPAPQFPPVSLRGSRGRGIAYEKKVGRWLAAQLGGLGLTIYDHPWLEGPCQPDFLIESVSGGILLIECKLTETDCSAQVAKYKSALAPQSVTWVQIARRVINRPDIRDILDARDGAVLLLWI